jgi:RNA polymerase sigma factor (TIGR02999 family)
MPAVYARLHALAESYLRNQPAGHTLQPTALVNEAYLKLVDGAEQTPRGGPKWESRAHFFAVAAKAMHQILVDHARSKHRQKRAGSRRRVPLEDLEGRAPLELDLVELDEALARLSAVDALGARVTEMRFFGGMGVEDIAAVLGTTDRTVRRHWVFAKAWLCRELAGGEEADR